MAIRAKDIVQQTGNRLSVEIHHAVAPISNADWARLFPHLRDSVEMVRLVEKSGVDGFDFHSIIVFEQDAQGNDRPILLLPLIETQRRIENEYEGPGRQVLARLARFFPQVFHPRLLAVSFEEGEGGQIGFDPDVSLSTLHEAWQMALQAMESLATGLQVDMMAFIDFSSDTGGILPMHLLQDYQVVDSHPCGHLPIGFSSLEDYIGSLSKLMRKDIRRKLRSVEDKVRIIRTTEPEPWLAQIYAFYQGVVNRSELVFGIQRPSYFRDVCQVVPGAHYVLYFVGEELVAFNLLVVKDNILVDKYFGMDLAQGRPLSLYFVSWMENVRYCIEHKISLYHAGPASEEQKIRLGATLTPFVLLFKFKNRFIQRCVRSLSRYMIYKSAVPVPPVTLGAHWSSFAAQVSNVSPISSGIRPASVSV